MSRREEYEQKAEELITPIVEANGFELVDVEYVKEGGTWYLRAYIDKEGGITVDDCEIVSRAFSDRLDAEDFIDDAYIMEVSSPGLGRPLKKEKDYKRSMGKELEIRTYRAIERNREFYGILTAYDDNSVTILEEDGTERVFQKSDIALIRLAFDFYRNDIAEFIAGVCTFCIGKGDLHDRILYQINNGFLCYDFEITSLGVDAYLYIICFAKMVFTGLDQRLLNCLKQGIFADILLFLKNFKGLH